MTAILIIIGLILLFKFVLTSHAATSLPQTTSLVNNNSCGSAGDNFTSGNGIVAGVSEPNANLRCDVAPMPLPAHITYPVLPPPVRIQTPIISPTMPKATPIAPINTPRVTSPLPRLMPRVYQSGSGTRYNIFPNGSLGVSCDISFGGGGGLAGSGTGGSKVFVTTCSCELTA